MTRRNALIGFTEAELGFVVAAVVAFTAAAEMPSTRHRARVVAATDSPRAVAESAHAIRPAVESAQVVVVALAGVAAERARPKWASDVLRRGCAEVEGQLLRRVPIDVIDVDGTNRYRVGGVSMSLQQLDRLLAPYEDEARENVCRYTLQFRPGRGIGARELLEAEDPFQGRFYREHRLR